MSATNRNAGGRWKDGHVYLALLRVDDRALGETRVGAARGGDVREELGDGVRRDVERIHVRKELLVPLTGEDEKRLEFMVQNH